jgi:hypothetical protein
VETPAGFAFGEETASDADGADVVTAEVLDEPEKQADDFTTDTLAELYISQGFFEKAIDIYERMLADHPTSAGLKEKLASVRAMAATVEQAEDEAAQTAPEDPGEKRRRSSEAGADVFVPPPPGFGQPRLDDWELPATQAAPVSAADASSRPARQPKPFDLGFEPREYVPPDALPRVAAPASAVNTAATQNAESTPVDKKETVERLESWLKNIMKET